MNQLTSDEIRAVVRENYGKVASKYGCCSGESSCGTADATPRDASITMGYTPGELDSVPDASNLGLGCGNPLGIAGLKEGETVVDLGSGGGLDCFLAAKAVGSSGRVIGVDMTGEMISRARKNAAAVGATNVEFRLGEIEQLPVESDSVDVVISNCVLNLSPDKQRVFAEAFRVLKPSGRLAISDVIARINIPEEIRNDPALHTGCVAGAVTSTEIGRMLDEVGFERVRIKPKNESSEFIQGWVPGMRVDEYVVSATIEAVKPAGVLPS